MRHFHSTITPAVIHREARQALQARLDCKPFHDSVSVADLLDLLLLMAAATASLFATVRRFFGFSHETARRAVQANLPTMDRLVKALVQTLFDVADFSRQDRRRSWLLALDTHNVAYYGQRGSYVVGGPKKQGTKWFFSYATAVLLHKRRRYTVALCPVQAKTKPHEIVQTLLDQIAAQGLKIRGVALDSAFDSGDTLLLLQARRLAYTVPLRRKGNTRNARNRYFEGRHGLIRWAEWTTEKTRCLVRTRTLLWKRGPKTMVFAFQGWNGGVQSLHSLKNFEKMGNLHQKTSTLGRNTGKNRRAFTLFGTRFPHSCRGGQRLLCAIFGIGHRNMPVFRSPAWRLNTEKRRIFLADCKRFTRKGCKSSWFSAKSRFFPRYFQGMERRHPNGGRLGTFTSKRSGNDGCTDNASASKRATGKRTRLRPPPPAVTPSTACCWRASGMCCVRSGWF